MTKVIIMASNKKEAKASALESYGADCVYVKPYKYASKGNNFYEFSALDADNSEDNEDEIFSTEARFLTPEQQKFITEAI